MAFDASKWILVGDLDIDPYTKPQIDICKNMNLPLKGAILCSDKDHKDSPACFQVPAFPAFCNVDSKMCISGMRETAEHFEDLQKKSNEKLNTN
jgi:hypothetical protein